MIKYEVPLPWLIGTAATISMALFYAGFQASQLKTQLETAVKLAKEVVVTQDAMQKDILDLKVKDQLTEAKVSQIEQRIDRMERR